MLNQFSPGLRAIWKQHVMHGDVNHPATVNLFRVENLFLHGLSPKIKSGRLFTTPFMLVSSVLRCRDDKLLIDEDQIDVADSVGSSNRVHRHAVLQRNLEQGFALLYRMGSRTARHWRGRGWVARARASGNGEALPNDDDIRV